jgi:predicted dehydrogenase
LRVGLAGIGFMGRAHSFAWNNAARIYDLDPIEMAAVAGGPEDATENVEAFARRWGWATAVTSWEDLVHGPVDVIDVCTPNDSHDVISVAALREGKHVLCEKPMSSSLSGAERMEHAAAEAGKHGVFGSIGFVYRRIPAVSLAKKLIDSGGIGDIVHFSGKLLQDSLLDTDRQTTWRLRRDIAGSGVIGDLGAHLVDLILYLTDDTLTVSSTKTASYAVMRGGQAGVAAADTEDVALCVGSLAGGALVDLRLSRVAVSRKVDLGFDIFGSRGRISFELQRPGELIFVQAADGFQGVVERTILVTECFHPYQELWWEPGQPVGYENAHIHQIGDFISALREGRSPVPSFADGLRVQRVLDQMISNGISNPETHW